MVKAKDLKKGDRILYEGEILEVTKVEVSNIGKHGRAKVRIEAKNKKGEEKVLIRPDEADVKKA